MLFYKSGSFLEQIHVSLCVQWLKIMEVKCVSEEKPGASRITF